MSKLSDLVASGESGNAGYDAYNRGTKGGRIVGADHHIALSELSIGEIQSLQSLPPGDPNRLLAVGKYQVIGDTLDGAVTHLHLDTSEKFTPQLQEQIFSDYLIADKRHAVIKAYIIGKSSDLSAAQLAMAEEWRSIADPHTGERYVDPHHKGPNPNHASITSDEVAAALDSMRAEYQSSIAKGMAPDGAWKAVTATDGTLTKPQQQSADHVSHRGSLRQGDHSEAVGITQQELHDLGYTDAKGRPLAVDNDFGPATRAAIKAFQHDHGLADDGIVGGDTASALTSQVDALQKNLGPDLHTPSAATITKDSSTQDMFEAICTAASKGDSDGLCAVGQAYSQSPEGQTFMAMGAQMNQAQAATQQAQQVLTQPQAQVPQGPAMSL